MKDEEYAYAISCNSGDKTNRQMAMGKNGSNSSTNDDANDNDFNKCDIGHIIKSNCKTVCHPHKCKCHNGHCDIYIYVEDRKSTRLNSSHVSISYAVFCLKKKKKITNTNERSNT